MRNDTAVGYVLVSQMHETYRHTCDKPGCESGPYGLCSYPQRPPCHAACVHVRELLENHPDCQQYQRDVAAWEAAHSSERATGGTRLGPLHYFRDCHTLNHRGPRRKDARIIALDPGVAEDLGLPVCKACQAKMAPLESQFAIAGLPSGTSAHTSTSTGEESSQGSLQKGKK